MTSLRHDLSARRLVAAAAADWVGTGLFVVSAPIFLLKAVGLSPGVIGAGLTAAGAVGWACSAAVGAVGDPIGAQRLLVYLHLVRAATVCGVRVARARRVSFILLSTVILAADQAAPAVTQSVVADIAEASSRVRLMAAIRTIVNVAMGIGALGAALALSAPTREVFAALLLFNAMSFMIAAVLVARIRRTGGVAPEPAEPAPLPATLQPLRSLRFAYRGVCSASPRSTGPLCCTSSC